MPLLCLKKKIIIADSKIVQAKVFAQNWNAPLIFCEGGELSKTRKKKEEIEDQLFSLDCQKDCSLIVVGGGVLSDLVGFVAATYMRGLSLILIPTTLLAMVDAAIGGKNGINTREGKNLIGSFHEPEAIWIDFNFLKTLPSSEFLNGLAEVIKYGLILDLSLWNLLEKVQEKWIESFYLEKIIQKSMEAKISVVQKDFYENSYRAILNYGHTIAHGLEQLSHYEMSHGQAVAIGLLTESFLSYDLRYLPLKSFQRIEKRLLSYPFDFKLPPSFSRENFYKTLKKDKKVRNQQIRFNLLQEISSPLVIDQSYTHPIPDRALDRAFDWMEKTFS